MKRCRRHWWIKEKVKVQQDVKFYPGAINRDYQNQEYQVEICFHCNKIRQAEQQTEDEPPYKHWLKEWDKSGTLYPTMTNLFHIIQGK